MTRLIKIAIDGPVAAGKSTVARELAKATGFVYVDTGAMYRALTYLAMQQKLDLNNEEVMTNLAMEAEIEVLAPQEHEKDGRVSTVKINGDDVSWNIRATQVSEVVAGVASMPRVREILVPKQQKIASQTSVVMEGRDITYVVLPEADLKIFLTAEEEVRVERYYQMLKVKDASLTKEHARTILQQRDELDKNRETSPLKIVPDAWVLDSSELSIEGVVAKIVEKVVAIQAQES